MKIEERRLIRYLGNQVSEAERRRFEEELRQDADLARRHREFAALWGQLDGPPVSSLPEEFSRHIVSRALQEATKDPLAGSLRWSQAPGWARLGATAALLMGLTVGSVAGARQNQPSVAGYSLGLESAVSHPVEELDFLSPGLADSYWSFVEGTEWADPGLQAADDDPSSEEGGRR